MKRVRPLNNTNIYIKNLGINILVNQWAYLTDPEFNSPDIQSILGLLIWDDNGIILNPPTDVEVIVDHLDITVNFTPDPNALFTEIEIPWENKTILINNNTFSFHVERPKTLFWVIMRSINGTNVSGWETHQFFSGPWPVIIPGPPTNIIITVNGKEIIVDFTPGNNAFITQLLETWNGYDTFLSTTGNSLTIHVSEFNKPYTFGLRSQSSTGGITEWDYYHFTSGINVIPPIPLNPPTAIIAYAVGLNAIISFIKDPGAVSTTLYRYWDNTTMSTTQNYFSFSVPNYNTVYDFKLQSVNGANVSVWTPDSNFTTGAVPPIGVLTVLNTPLVNPESLKYNIIGTYDPLNPVGYSEDYDLSAWGINTFLELIDNGFAYSHPDQVSFVGGILTVKNFVLLDTDKITIIYTKII